MLSSNSFLNTKIMNVISFCYYGFISVIEKKYYYEKILNIELLQNYLTIDNIDLSLIHQNQNYINDNTKEIRKQKIFISTI